jgi:hypothetical protein
VASQATISDICHAVESVLGETPRLSRKVQVFLCRKHTTVSLVVIGDRFGIGDSAVAQSCSRFLNDMKINRRLRRQVDKIEKKITMWNVETCPRVLCIDWIIGRRIGSFSNSRIIQSNLSDYLMIVTEIKF